MRKNKFNDNNGNITHCIHPSTLPRPSYNNDYVYKNENGKNTHVANMNNYYYIPFAASDYCSVDGNNSSIRLIRPSMNVISENVSFYKKSTTIPFGFNIEPFGNCIYEEEIMQTFKFENENCDLIKCNNCGCYYNERFNVNYHESTSNETLIFECNICDKKGMCNKKEIIQGKINPSVDIVYNDHIYDIKLFTIIMVDISYISLKNNYTIYILDSLKHIFSNEKYESNNNKSITKMYGFVLYNAKSIYYMYIQNNIVKMSIMKDMQAPFCPLNYNEFFTSPQNCIDILEKIYTLISTTFIDFSHTFKGSCLNSCIYALYDIVNHNTNKLIWFNALIFSCNCLSPSLLYMPEETEPKDESDTNLYTPQHMFIFQQEQKFTSNNLSFHLFITGENNNQIHLANYTKFNIHYYPINYSNRDDIKQKYEKLYYDIESLLNNKNNEIFNVEYSFNFNPKLFSAEIHTLFSNEIKLKENKIYFISYISHPEKWNLMFEIFQKKHIHNHKHTSFQFWVKYISSNDSNKHLRILNITLPIVTNIPSLINSLDNDCLTKLFLCSELKYNKYNLNKTKVSIKDKLVNLFYTSQTGFIFNFENEIFSPPPNIRYLLLYIYSFFIITIFYREHHPNSIVWTLYKLFSFPLKEVILMLYPYLFEINISLEKHTHIGLSMFYLRHDFPVLWTDKEYAIIFIPNENINKQEIENYVMNVIKIEYNCPIKYIYISNKEQKLLLYDTLIEDNLVNINNKYCDYVYEINTLIGNKILDYL